MKEKVNGENESMCANEWEEDKRSELFFFFYRAPRLWHIRFFHSFFFFFFFFFHLIFPLESACRPLLPQSFPSEYILHALRWGHGNFVLQLPSFLVSFFFFFSPTNSFSLFFFLIFLRFLSTCINITQVNRVTYQK